MINLDSIGNSKSNWVLHKKNNLKIIKFFSFGNFRPPTELLFNINIRSFKPTTVFTADSNI